MSEDQENYKLHKKSGYVFIFNNNLFWQTAKIRYGSEKDCESITKTFEKLNFIVKTFENLNYKTNVEEKMKIGLFSYYNIYCAIKKLNTEINSINFNLLYKLYRNCKFI